jgi:hypothetical protein
MQHQLKYGATSSKRIIIPRLVAFGEENRVTVQMFKEHQKKYENALYAQLAIAELFATRWLMFQDFFVDVKELRIIGNSSRLNQPIIGVPMFWQYQVPNTNKYILLTRNMKVAIIVTLHND